MQNKIHTIAFPILGAGHYGYPLDMAILCALEAFKQVDDNSISVKLVCYTEEEFNLASQLAMQF